ncbi:hypothetical protein CSUB01_03489 [Colletotrichum sublineola]|uniref:Uncharacterized protein n=1 Tax=Colletotrichum sublineola TaxID=1173701 RepID=A0A066WY27_COLSU|nr:hypothetical protein CSUB01_03489 [Colletotrichum sublineola]
MALSYLSFSQSLSMRETYYGLIGTPEDAKIIIQACETGLLSPLEHRLSPCERQSIRSGSVFAFKKPVFGKWLDEKTWSKPVTSKSFLIHHEITNQGMGLTRQSFSISSGDQDYRIVSFYSGSDPQLLTFKRPSTDSLFENIKPPNLPDPEPDIHNSNPVLSSIIAKLRRNHTAPQAHPSMSSEYTALPSNALPHPVHRDSLSAPFSPAMSPNRPLDPGINGELSAPNITVSTRAIRPQAVGEYALTSWGQSGSDASGKMRAPTNDVHNTLQLAFAAPSEPRQVLIDISGDTGAYLYHVKSQAKPQDTESSLVRNGSVSVTRGDQVQLGWSTDYYGASNVRIHDGKGIGWQSQKNESKADDWPRKYVCCICSLQWNAIPVPSKFFRDDVVEPDRKRLRLSNPPDALRDPGFTRPQFSEAHLLSSKSQGHEAFLAQLTSRVMHGHSLSEIDEEISYRLMYLFNNLDYRGRKRISSLINGIPLPGDISSPAVLREHTQWMTNLGLYAPNVYRQDFLDPKTGQLYYREYVLDGVEVKPGDMRIIWHATGRVMNPSRFLLDS